MKVKTDPTSGKTSATFEAADRKVFADAINRLEKFAAIERDTTSGKAAQETIVGLRQFFPRTPDTEDA